MWLLGFFEYFSFLPSFLVFFLLFFLSCFLFRAALSTCGSYQGRGYIGISAASLCHSHSHVRSEPCLRPTTQLTAKLDPNLLNEDRDRTTCHGYQLGSLPLSHDENSLFHFLTLQNALGSHSIILALVLESAISPRSPIFLLESHYQKPMKPRSEHQIYLLIQGYLYFVKSSKVIASKKKKCIYQPVYIHIYKYFYM